MGGGQGWSYLLMVHRPLLTALKWGQRTGGLDRGCSAPEPSLASHGLACLGTSGRYLVLEILI